MINDEIRARKIVFARNPAYAMLNANEDGTITNKLTGELYQSLNEALRATTASSLADFRVFDPSRPTMMPRVGGAALESEVAAINSFIGKTSAEELTRLGLGRLAGKQVAGTFLLYNWQSDASQLKGILDPTSLLRQKYPGFANITDEGVQVFSFGIAGEDAPLGALEQALLKTAAKVPTFRQDNAMIEKIAGAVARGDQETLGGYLAKLPKRVSSQISPRTVSFTRDEMVKAFSKIKRS